MNKLILIMGDLASGKSTFADILSKKYAIPSIKKDVIKELLGDTIGFTNREENLKLSRATFEIMLHSFDRISLSGGDLILESNFRSAELARLVSLADYREYKVLSLYLSADTDTLYKRYTDRIKKGRHAVHLTTGFDDYQGFVHYVEAQRPEKIPGELIKIDAGDFSYQSDFEIFDRIYNFLL